MARITPDEALQRLSTAQPQGMHKAKGTPSIIYQGDLEDGAMYIFTQGEEAILSPSDNELPAVIGRFDGSQGNGIPPAMAAFLQETAAEIAYKANAPTITNAPRKVAKATTSKRVTVQPLVKTKWGQGIPYNANLTFGGKKSLVGCNAVAIGQILHYFGVVGWKGKVYHRGCKATSSYTTKTDKYKVAANPPVTVFDYANMTTGKPKTDKEKAAVANMLEQVAKAIKSDFSPSGTLAYLTTDVTILRNYLRMGSPRRIIASKGYDAFEQQIYNDIVDGRPVIMIGYTVNGGGHCFVVDGYNAATDMYHFNWGWSGSCDGWFKLTALDLTSTRSYNSNKEAVVGIKPEYILGDVDGNDEVTITDATAIVQAAADGSKEGKYDINSDGKVTTADANAVVEHVLGKDSL